MTDPFVFLCFKPEIETSCSTQTVTSALPEGNFQLKSQKATQNLTKDFRFMRGDSIYRHREEPRLELYTPDNETLPIPLKYVAVMRRDAFHC